MQRTTLTLATIDLAINRKQLVRNSARKLKNTANLQRNLQLQQKAQLLPRITKRAKELKLHRTNHASTAENLTSPIKNPNERYKTRNHRTKLDEQRTTVAPARNHTENYENLQELTL